jgi:type IV pilus assembly protein PilA
MITLIIVGVLAAIGIPAYQDYVLRSRLVQAFEFADAARTSVMIDTLDGPVPKTDHRYMNLDPTRSNALVDLSWFKGKDASGIKGYLLATVALKGDEAKDLVKAFALEWRDNGDWYCVPGGKYGGNKAQPMDEKYLPAMCREGSGTALGTTKPPTAAAPTCPPGQDVVTLTSAGKSHDACTPKCAAGQTRDAANPTQCINSLVPNVPVALVQPEQSATNSVATGKPDAAASVSAPAAKPPAAAAAAAPAGTGRRPGAAGQAPIQCHVCDPALPELCELVTVETTCTAPNNFCFTFVDNHADGTKTVQRSCGNFERAYREWWQGTSDDDKCRERIDIEQHLDFTCTFACEKPNCNQSGASLRPADDALYMDK